MNAQKGRDILLKVKSPGTTEAYKTILGLRTKTLSLNAETIDISHSNSEGWRELLANAGLSQAAISGAGVFLNDELAHEVRSIFFSGDIRSWEVILPGFGKITGPFQITNLDYAGEYKEEVSISITLESAGVLMFTKTESV